MKEINTLWHHCFAQDNIHPVFNMEQVVDFESCVVRQDEMNSDAGQRASESSYKESMTRCTTLVETMWLTTLSRPDSRDTR